MFFLTGYNGIFDFTNSNNMFSFAKSISDEVGFIQIVVPPGAHEIDGLNNEINEILLMNILLKLIIRSQSNQIFQHLDLL